ncbi:MAG: multicopper oxidase domain-containing protein [Methylohalobius sp.]|nr:multicopper oxidase domain-containing protein [Methylohalobius sp.]
MRIFLAAVAGTALLGSVSAAVYFTPSPEGADRGYAIEPFCPKERPKAWRAAQLVENVQIQEERTCWPDNPYEVAAFVKGTNNVSVPTLMKTPLAADAVVKQNDYDRDGDPDEIIIKLEIVELNGAPLGEEGVPEFSIASGIRPALWVFSPKLRLLADQDSKLTLRFPSPVIRVEAGDKVQIVLENTHYLPHAFALFGVDHPFSNKPNSVLPGQNGVYEFAPRQPGTMFYYAASAADVALGLIGMFIVEENRPNNWVQTFNLGAGKVRYPSRSVLEKFDQEYDLQYQTLDKELHQIVQAVETPEQVNGSLRKYAWSKAEEDYFVLNGRMFPYVLRESPIVVKPDQAVKLRLFNAHGERVTLAFDGHKVIVTHYDGLEHHPLSQIARDVIDLAPRQRLDLSLLTSNDGLHSFGPGVWSIAGQSSKGGMVWRDLGAIVYESFLGPDDTPAVELSPFFAPGDKPLLELPETEKLPLGRASKLLYDLVIGLFLGFLAYVLFSNRRRAQERVRGCFRKVP